MEESIKKRQESKTVEQQFVRTLSDEFQFAPRLAQAVLREAQASQLGEGKRVADGQIRRILNERRARGRQALRSTASVEVSWTLDAGAEDQAVLEGHGRVALRRVRRQRLLDEALAQGAAATQEDLAQALNVGLRTIKRNFEEMQAQGLYLPTRGNLQGIGRGQTHKAQILGRWLRGETVSIQPPGNLTGAFRGAVHLQTISEPSKYDKRRSSLVQPEQLRETYDQLRRHTHHSNHSIRRSIQSLVRVVELHE
jgi:hypothetical protein